MSLNEQPSVSVGGLPVIEQVPGPAYAGLIDQSIPVPPGSGSLSVTALAVPGPEFDTVIVKPIGLPALTVDESAVLLIARFGQLTVVDAFAFTLCAFVAAATAVLSYVAQLA